MPNILPERLHPLFWDIRVDEFDQSAHPRYTIARVLEYGQDVDVAWLLEIFSKDRIREVLRTDRRLTPRSATFWALVFDVPAGDVLALADVRAPAPGPRSVVAAQDGE